MVLLKFNYTIFNAYIIIAIKQFNYDVYNFSIH